MLVLQLAIHTFTAAADISTPPCHPPWVHVYCLCKTRLSNYPNKGKNILMSE
jgi:hypothetical protein